MSTILYSVSVIKQTKESDNWEEKNLSKVFIFKYITI